MTASLLQKHRKLVIAQIAGILAVLAFAVAALRYEQTGEWREQMFGSFVLFGILLLAAEVKCLLDWMRQRKAERGGA